jgi:hypothetical protein
MLVWGWLLEKQRVQTKTKTSSPSDLEGWLIVAPIAAAHPCAARKTLLTS